MLSGVVGQKPDHSGLRTKGKVRKWRQFFLRNSRGDVGSREGFFLFLKIWNTRAYVFSPPVGRQRETEDAKSEVIEKVRTIGKRLACARKGPSFFVSGWKMEMVGTDISKFSDCFGGRMMVFLATRVTFICTQNSA